MFSTSSVKHLRKVISTYRKYHDIKGSSRMSKTQLVAELEKRFIIKNGELFLKGEVPTAPTAPTPTAPTAQKVKKRIAPTLVSQPSTSGNIPQATSNKTKGQQRMDSTIERMEKHYTDPNLKYTEDKHSRWGF